MYVLILPGLEPDPHPKNLRDIDKTKDYVRI